MYRVEVQHSNDHMPDGKWFTISDNLSTFRRALDELIYMQGWRVPRSGKGYYQSYMGYWGRPLRIVEVK